MAFQNTPVLVTSRVTQHQLNQKFGSQKDDYNKIGKKNGRTAYQGHKNEGNSWKSLVKNWSPNLNINHKTVTKIGRSY